MTQLICDVVVLWQSWFVSEVFCDAGVLWWSWWDSCFVTLICAGVICEGIDSGCSWFKMEFILNGVHGLGEACSG